MAGRNQDRDLSSPQFRPESSVVCRLLHLLQSLVKAEAARFCARRIVVGAQIPIANVVTHDHQDIRRIRVARFLLSAGDANARR